MDPRIRTAVIEVQSAATSVRNHVPGGAELLRQKTERLIELAEETKKK